MNLSEIELTAEQHVALLDLLNERAFAMRVMRANAEQEQQQAEIDEARHEKLRDLATRTARMHGKLVGVDLLLQAIAAWQTFIQCESWFSPYDVDEHWVERDGPDWKETWTHAYCTEAGHKQQPQVPA